MKEELNILFEGGEGIMDMDISLFLIKAFSPYCIRRTGKSRNFDLTAGLGMFILAYAISSIDIILDEKYSHKKSWFQTLCSQLENELPILTLKQAEELDGKWEMRA